MGCMGASAGGKGRRRGSGGGWGTCTFPPFLSFFGRGMLIFVPGVDRMQELPSPFPRLSSSSSSAMTTPAQPQTCHRLRARFPPTPNLNHLHAPRSTLPSTSSSTPQSHFKITIITNEPRPIPNPAPSPHQAHLQPRSCHSCGCWCLWESRPRILLSSSFYTYSTKALKKMS